MKKSTLISLIVLLTLLLTQLACSQTTIPVPTLTRGSGSLVSEERPVSGFDSITINGAGEVVINQGTTESLKIEAEDNIISNITSEVEDGTLVIGYDKELWDKKILPSKTMRYFITVIDLVKVTINGAAELNNDSLKTGSFDLKINGAGDLEFNNLVADQLTVEIAGGAGLKAVGEVTSQVVVINGAGFYRADELKSSQAEITFNGAGSAFVWATDTLKMTINGAGTINYFGSPQVTQTIIGLGSIKHMEDK